MSHSVTCVFLRFWQFACLCFEWLIIMLLFVMIGRCDYSSFAFEKELAECRHVKSAAITPSLHLLHLFVFSLLSELSYPHALNDIKTFGRLINNGN